MSNHRVYLDDIYASEACKGSTFRAVVMMAQEARFINEQAVAGYLQLSSKPTTIAMDKFKSNRLTMLSHEEAEARREKAKQAETRQTSSEQASDETSTESANDAFGI